MRPTHHPSPLYKHFFILAFCLAASLWACGTTATVSVLTPDDLKLDSASQSKLPPETLSDIQYAFDQLANPETKPKDKVELYSFLSAVHLEIWNDKRNAIDALQPGQGGYEQPLKDAQPHFMKAYWAKALERRESRLATDVYGQSADRESRFANLWADYSNPKASFDTLKVLLDELLSSKDYVDPSFVSDVRYSLAIFYTLQGLPTDSLTPFLDLTRQDQRAALAFAQEVAFLQERLMAKPDISAKLYTLIASTVPESRQGYESQSLYIRSLWKYRFFRTLASNPPSAFDTSPEGSSLFSQIADATGAIVTMFPTRDKWPIAERQDVDKVDAATEEAMRLFINQMHNLGVETKDTAYFDLSSRVYTDYTKVFPYSGAAYTLAYEHALALEKAGRPDDAYSHYQNAHKLNANGAHKLDVVRGMMRTTYEKAKAAPLPSEPSETRIDLPDAHKRFIDAAERYITTFEEDDAEANTIKTVRYEIALRHYLHGAIPVAEPMLEQYLMKFTDAEMAPKAAIVFLDLMARKQLRARNKKDRTELDNAILRVEGVPSIRENPEVKAKLADVAKNPPRVGKTIF